MSNSKFLLFANEFNSSEFKIISKEDNSHYDDVIYEWMLEELESDIIEELDKCLEKENWNPERFIEIYNTFDQDNWSVHIIE